MSKMPIQKPGRSEQSVGTPPEFLRAVLNRLRENDFIVDLAASEDNFVVKPYLTEEDDALSKDWDYEGGWCWLNPPYGDMEPWVQKAYESSIQLGTKTTVLVPASVGSNWWARWVSGKAYITFLNGRITFLGHDAPYPRDLALLLYAPFLEGGSCIWRWK